MAQYRFVVKGDDGKFRPGAALAALAASFDNNLRAASLPVLNDLADILGMTTSLLVSEGDEQVALAVVVQTFNDHRPPPLEGSRCSVTRGASGAALLSSMPPRPGESDLTHQAREQGWVIAQSAFESDTHCLAVPVERHRPSPSTCITLISNRRDDLLERRSEIMAAASRLSATLR